jgi:hypothetical protein
VRHRRPLRTDQTLHDVHPAQKEHGQYGEHDHNAHGHSQVDGQAVRHRRCGRGGSSPGLVFAPHCTNCATTAPPNSSSPESTSAPSPADSATPTPDSPSTPTPPGSAKPTNTQPQHSPNASQYDSVHSHDSHLHTSPPRCTTPPQRHLPQRQPTAHQPRTHPAVPRLNRHHPPRHHPARPSTTHHRQPRPPRRRPLAYSIIPGPQPRTDTTNQSADRTRHEHHDAPTWPVPVPPLTIHDQPGDITATEPTTRPVH